MVTLDMLLAAPSPVALAAALALLAFGPLSMLDGIYLHLVRYRLWARPDSQREHLLHTARSVLFLPVVLWVLSDATGLAFALGMLALLVDQAVEIADVLEERASRASTGGLPSGEYAVHAMLITLRAVAVTLALALRPAASWALDAQGSAGQALAWLATVSGTLVAPTVIVIALHVVLAIAPRVRPSLARQVAR